MHGVRVPTVQSNFQSIEVIKQKHILTLLLCFILTCTSSHRLYSVFLLCYISMLHVRLSYVIKVGPTTYLLTYLLIDSPTMLGLFIATQYCRTCFFEARIFD